MSNSRSYAGYMPTKRMMNPQTSQAQPQLDENQVLILQQQKQFTSQYLFSTFKQLSDAIETNTEHRDKYASQPEKFYESEAVLNDIISKLSAISAYSELVPDFIKSNLMKLLIQLLDHPNQMIVAETVQIFYEFLMMEIQSEGIVEQHLKYWKSIAGQYFLAKLLGLLDRLNQQVVAQYQTVYRILRITQELLTIDPKLSNTVVDCSKIMKYLSDRILPNFIIEYKKIDDNKFVASEILVELLQFSHQNRFTFHKFKGMQILLECIIPYKEKKLQQDMELQFIVNIFDLVCIMNLQRNAKQVFNSEGGLELMIHFVKLKNYLSKHALKCLSSGLIKDSVKPFIENGGLKYIFPILLHQGIKEKQLQKQMSLDQSITQIVLALLQLAEGMDLDRIVYKFKQKNFEKLLRLIEMRVQYSDIIGQKQEYLEEQEYIKKLGQGLRIIQLIDLILLHLIVSNRQMKSNVKEMFKYFQFNTRRIEISLNQHLKNLSPTSEQYEFISREKGNMFPFLVESQ